MTLEELVRYKALHLKYVSDNTGLMDMLVDGQLEHNMPLKNVCAMVSHALFDDITNMCGMLEISKRAFIEAALIEALFVAEKVLEQEHLYDYLGDKVEA